MIDDVIGAVRDAVLDEGIDEAVLGDLKTLWKKKLDESRALEGPHQDQQVRNDKIYLTPTLSESLSNKKGFTDSVRVNVFKFLGHVRLYERRSRNSRALST